MTIRELIIAKRNELGMTQKELSQKTGIPQSRISEFEKGTRQMLSGNIDAIFSELGIKHYNETKDKNLDFATECAQVLIEKGISSIKKLTREDLAVLCSKPEFIYMKVLDKDYDEQQVLKLGVDPDNSFDYLKTLITLKLAVLGKK